MTWSEDALEQLEGIVRSMEEEKIPLDELIAKYESGSKLLAICRQQIAGARTRIEAITHRMNGSVELEEFEDGPAESAEAGKKDIKLL